MDNFFPKKGSKIAVALSGGVDSGVAAKILKDKGYNLAGFWLWMGGKELLEDKFLLSTFKPSPTKQQKVGVQIMKVPQKLSFRDMGGQSWYKAYQTASLLNIPFYIFDFRQAFKQQVIDYFINTYQTGGTPNPCVICNQAIKFGRAWTWAKNELQADYLATGHYVRNIKYQTSKLNNKHMLVRAKDKNKDQSYFLYAIDQKILDKLVFPIGDYNRAEVEKIAQKWCLPVAKNNKSVDVCFAKDWRSFLQKVIGRCKKDGRVFDINNNYLGKHKGIIYYTVGQRARFVIDSQLKTSYTPKYYIVNKDMKNNKLVVGGKKDVSREKISLEKVNWLISLGEKEYRTMVKIRSVGRLLPAEIKATKGGAVVNLKRPEPGIASGQSVVFYIKANILAPKLKNLWAVLGGGTIRAG